MDELFNHINIYEVEPATNFYRLDENGQRHEPTPTLIHRLSPATYRVKVGFETENFTDLEKALKYYRKQLKKAEKELTNQTKGQ